MVTPQDVRKKEFEVKLRGYDKDEVDAFLDAIYNEMRRLVEENRKLAEDKASLEDTVKRYHDMEDTMRQTIDTARITAQQVVKAARTEAENVKMRAQLEVKSEIMKIDEEHQRMIAETKLMQQRIDELAMKVKAGCQAFLDEMNRIKK